MRLTCRLQNPFTMSVAVCILVVLVLFTSGRTGFSSSTQPSLGTKSVFRVEKILARDPADNTREVSGIGVTLPNSIKHHVSIEFRGKSTNRDVNSFRRVKVYEPSKTIKTDCPNKECWVSLKQLSNDGGTLEFDLDEATPRRILITSWTPTLTAIRSGIPDEFRKVKSVKQNGKKGIRLEFASTIETKFTTIVTIMPL